MAEDSLSTTIQAANRFSRSVTNRLGRIAGKITCRYSWRLLAPMMRATCR